MEELNETKCTYCGSEYKIEREHVIPVTWFGFRTFDDRRQWIVPACRDCNQLAGDKLFFSIPEKAEYLQKRYKLRFRKLLSIPYWSPDELAELDRNLRVSVEASIISKVVVQQRLSYIEMVKNFSKEYKRPEWVAILYAEYKEALAKKKRNNRKNKK